MTVVLLSCTKVSDSHLQSG